MKLISVNCGLPKEVLWHGQTVTTSIFKEPVEGRVALRTLNLDGDRQSDLAVHGGKDKAVYCYQLSHYECWKAKLPGRPLPPGSFGENFTIDGPDDNSIHIGDRFAVGSAEVVVTQPRMPCYKLGVRFESDEMIKRFLESGRMGFYLAVTREGEVGAGDEIRTLSLDPHAVPVSAIMRLYLAKKYEASDAAMVRRALEVESLTDTWKDYFREELTRKGTPRI
jgi:MOSC domain-containing protein YiiM